MHEAQHIAFIPRVKHTEVVRDVIGTVLPWGHAKVLGVRDKNYPQLHGKPAYHSYRAQGCM